ncbi:MAG: D-glycero-beta-D-manno-heptose-7-phosphate kinase [Actinobacteria bacterium]|nr:D-glycero-beta-D-manno-heptose-7-phosphate kinase [Actinomycetota bacterium]
MAKEHKKHADPKRLRSLLKLIKGKKILVVGDVGVDSYMMGKVERISPEAPVPVIHVQEERLKLGLAANVADNIQALGAHSLLVGVIGKDKAAEDMVKLLRDARARVGHLVEEPYRKTILKTRMVAQNQQLIRIDHESQREISQHTEDKVIAELRRLVPEADAIILEDYAKGMVTPTVAKTLFKLAKKHKKIVAVDPNLKTPSSLYKGATLLTPNTGEAEKLSGTKINCEASLKKAGHKILKATNAPAVIITRGKDGMAIFQKDGSVQLIPTFAKEVFDVSGAGDTVISVLTLCLSAGASLYEAAILANVAAGIEVSKPGTATVSTEEINRTL